jgi:hypothetical protein
MSTWHDDEPLEQAIWFFIESAFPLDDEIDTTSYVSITVANSTWLRPLTMPYLTFLPSKSYTR